MIIDKLAEFCDATALSTAATGRAAIGNNINLGVPARDIGQGQPLYLVVTVDTAVTGTSSTVSFELVSDGQDPPAADASETLHYASEAFPEASLVQGFRFVVPLPMVNPAYEQFLGLQQNVGTAALTAGKINAFLTQDPHGWQAYPEGQN